MSQFSKTCPSCNKRFAHLEDFMEYGKKVLRKAMIQNS